MFGTTNRDRSVPPGARNPYENRRPRGEGGKTGPGKQYSAEFGLHGGGGGGGGGGDGGKKKGCPLFVLAALAAFAEIAAVVSGAAWGVNHVFHIL